MSAAQKALATFEALNERQQTWLLVIYEHDQQAEDANSASWVKGQRDSQPASVWRWLEYGLVNFQLADRNGELQSALRHAKVWDQGAGATIAVLVERGLIETRYTEVGIGHRLWMKLTRTGRAAARAGGANDTAPRRTRATGQVTKAVWSMLAAVRQAGDQGLERMVSGAWQALSERDPALISLDDKRSLRTTIRLTAAGLAHYRDHWHAYAKLYPGIDAPHPDPAAVPDWPAEAEHHLQRLADAVHALETDLHGIDQRRRTLEPVRAPGANPTPEQTEAKRLRQQLHQLDQTAQDELARHHELVLELYRTAIARYAAVTTAVTNAVANGTDPRDSLHEPPAQLTSDDHLADRARPSTGLAGVDRNITTAYTAAHQGPRPTRRRRNTVQLGPGLQSIREPAGPNLAAVRDYAQHLHHLTRGGQLGRLLLRRDDNPRDEAEAMITNQGRAEPTGQAGRAPGVSRDA